MDGVQIGRIVHYVLGANDAAEADRRRVVGAGHGDSWPMGAQAHVGNVPHAGEHVAMVITAVFGEGGIVNGQALLDGNDSLWVTSRDYSEEPKEATWHWPERV